MREGLLGRVGTDNPPNWAENFRSLLRGQRQLLGPGLVVGSCPLCGEKLGQFPIGWSSHILNSKNPNMVEKEASHRLL